MKFDIIGQFIDSQAFQSLVDEAADNPDAEEVLNTIRLSLESLQFFAEKGITNRVLKETQALHKTIEFLRQVYEEEN